MPSPDRRGRRRRMAETSRGRVLDLTGGDHVDGYPTADVTVLDGHAPLPAGPYDTIVSAFRLASVGDVGGFVAELRDRLASGGELLLLEPARIGDVDVPMTVRGAGLTITDLDRFDGLIDARARISLV